MSGSEIPFLHLNTFQSTNSASPSTNTSADVLIAETQYQQNRTQMDFEVRRQEIQAETARHESALENERRIAEMKFIHEEKLARIQTESSAKLQLEIELKGVNILLSCSKLLVKFL